MQNAFMEKRPSVWHGMNNIHLFCLHIMSAKQMNGGRKRGGEEGTSDNSDDCDQKKVSQIESQVLT